MNDIGILIWIVAGVTTSVVYAKTGDFTEEKMTTIGPRAFRKSDAVIGLELVMAGLFCWLVIPIYILVKALALIGGLVKDD